MQKRMMCCFIAAMVLGLGFNLNSSSAEELYNANAFEARIKTLENKLWAIQQGEGVAPVPSAPGVGGCNGCADGCNDCGGNDCCSGITASVELLYLRPYGEDGGANTQDYEPASRYTLGWVTQGGLGIQARYFEYDVNLNVGGYDMYMADLEVYDSFCLGNWHGKFALGGRYAHYYHDIGTVGGVNFDGIGPYLGVELYRPLTCDFELYATGRRSLLYGEDNTFANDSYTTLNITEIQIGVQWRRDINSCAYVFARGGIEAQYIENSSENLGLVGGVFSVGIGR